MLRQLSREKQLRRSASQENFAPEAIQLSRSSFRLPRERYGIVGVVTFSDPVPRHT
ncbi:MAG: hypothetical protein ABJF23_15670 [Bryobacteraceae bacterium]